MTTSLKTYFPAFIFKKFVRSLRFVVAIPLSNEVNIFCHSLQWAKRANFKDEQSNKINSMFNTVSSFWTLLLTSVYLNIECWIDEICEWTLNSPSNISIKTSNWRIKSLISFNKSWFVDFPNFFVIIPSCEIITKMFWIFCQTILNLTLNLSKIFIFFYNSKNYKFLHFFHQNQPTNHNSERFFLNRDISFIFH